ncbi:MAG: hypothetical protein IJK42_09085 [Prevotella sp.]|nr:hypothetical protein [Prevotella sp.]
MKVKLFLLAWLAIGVCQAFGQKVGADQRVHPSVSILGDSYSTFAGWVTPDTMELWYFGSREDPKRTDVCKVSETWWHQLIKMMGWKLERNNSWSGSTICNTGYRDENATYKSFLTRMDNLGSPDVILIFGGTNDSWANAPIGDFMYEGWRMADLFYFRPAFGYMLDFMQERYPTAEIYVISNSELKESITQSMQTICDHYGIKMIQLHDIDKQNGHPNVKGMRQIAEQIRLKIQK